MFGESKYPANFDHVAQNKVMSAVKELNDLGPAAFDPLIAHFGDDRYSVTREGSENDVNESVGTVCRKIFSNHLEPHGGYVIVRPPGRVLEKVPSSRPSFIGHL